MIPARVVLSVESRTTSFVGTNDVFLRMHTYVPVFQIDFPDWVMESERRAFVVDSTVGLSLRSKLRFVLMFFFQNLSELPDTPCCRFVLLPRNAHGEPNSRKKQKTKSHCSSLSAKQEFLSVCPRSNQFSECWLLVAQDTTAAKDDPIGRLGSRT